MTNQKAINPLLLILGLILLATSFQLFPPRNKPSTQQIEELET